MLRSIVLILCILAVSSCNSNEEFIRENELFYFLMEQGVNIPSTSSTVLLLNNSTCESCVNSINEVLNILTIKQTENVIIILTDEISYQLFYSQIPSNAIVITSDPMELSSKGLSFPNSIIFFVKDSQKVTKWFEIVNITKDNIINEIRRR